MLTLRCVLTWLLLFAATAQANQMLYTTAGLGLDATRRFVRGTDDGLVHRDYVKIDQEFEGRAMALAGGRMYFSTETELFASDTDGGNIVQLFGQGLPPVSHIAASPSLVVFNEGQFIINTINPDGSGFTQAINMFLHATPSRIDSLTVDWDTNRVFVGDTDLNRIVTYDLNNPSAPAVVVSTYGHNVDIPDIQIADGKLYAAVADLPDNQTRVISSELDGTGAIDALTLANSGIRRLTIDGADLYYTSPTGIGGVGPGGIFKAGIDGSNLTLAIDGEGRDLHGLVRAPVVEPKVNNILVACNGGGIITCGALDEPTGIEITAPIDEGESLVSSFENNFGELPLDAQLSITEGNFVVLTGDDGIFYWNLQFQGELEGQALVTFQYDEASLSVPENEIAVRHFNGIEWEELPVFFRDLANNRIQVITDDFSPFILTEGDELLSSVVPEPSTFTLVAGLGLLGLVRRRRRR